MSNKPVHIAHVIYRFDTGGLENGVVNLINNLPEADFRHSIITHKGVNPIFASRVKTANVEYYDLEKKDGHDWGVYGRLNKVLKTLKPDLLHSRNLATIESQLVGWWRRVPLRIHGEHGWDMADVGGTNLKYQRLRRFLKPFIHHFVALSSEARIYLTDKIGVSANRITHICNGVQLDKFDTVQAVQGPLPDAFFTDASLVFGTVGRLADVKNQQYLVQAFSQLVAEQKEAGTLLRLVLVGDGGTRSKLEKQVEQAGLQAQVWFAGDRADVPALMQRMHVFVLPSLAEGISNTFLEAMASGLPVIATHVGGNPDLMPPEHKDHNLIPVNNVDALVNAMTRYIAASGLAGQEGEQARQHCRSQFSLANMVGKYQQLYQRAAR